MHSQNESNGSVAQLNRVLDYGSSGSRFESWRSHKAVTKVTAFLFFTTHLLHFPNFFVPLRQHWFSVGTQAPKRLKGNRVKIPNSSRCCNSHECLRHHLATGLWAGKASQKEISQKTCQAFTTRLCLRRMGKSATENFQVLYIIGITRGGGIFSRHSYIPKA